MDLSNEIIVTGWPRSGNTWTARLIADALDSPLMGRYEATPIGQEGLDRPGDYTVIQLHLIPNCEHANGKFIANRFHICPEHWQGERVVIVIRDPRDVAVSAWQYWKIDSLKDTIRRMYEVEWPLSGARAWHEFIRAWRAVALPVVWIKYEALIENPYDILSRLLQELGTTPTNDLNEVIERQSIKNKQRFFKRLTQEGKHWHPYGAGIQLKSLRQGIAGDWHNHFKREEAELLHSYFWETMHELGYEDDENWFHLI